MATDKVFICSTDSTCPKHGRYLYYCYECHEEWRLANPKRVLEIRKLTKSAQPKETP